MKIDLNVDVHHLARIEGHGNIKVSVRQGQLAEARWDVVETPRFFEVGESAWMWGGGAALGLLGSTIAVASEARR